MSPADAPEPVLELREARATGALRVLHVTALEASSGAGDARDSVLDPGALISALQGRTEVRQEVLEGSGSTVIALARTEFAPDVVHAHGARALRRAVVGLSLSGDPAPIVASLTDGEADSAASPALFRRAALLLLEPATHGRMLRSAGVERARLRLVDADPGDAGQDDAAPVAVALAGYRAVAYSERLRREFRRRQERLGRVRRALPTPVVDADGRR